MIGRIEDEASMVNIDSIIKAIDDLPLPITSYTYLKEELMKRGLTIELANWLSTSVKRISKNEYQFKFQTKHIRELLKSYRDADYWDVIGNPPSNSHIRIVRAERNVLWTEEIIERLELLSSAIPTQVSTKLVKNSGHWLQVDNPDGLQEAIHDLFSNCLVCYKLFI